MKLRIPLYIWSETLRSDRPVDPWRSSNNSLTLLNNLIVRIKPIVPVDPISHVSIRSTAFVVYTSLAHCPSETACGASAPEMFSPPEIARAHCTWEIAFHPFFFLLLISSLIICYICYAKYFGESHHIYPIWSIQPKPQPQPRPAQLTIGAGRFFAIENRPV